MTVFNDIIYKPKYWEFGYRMAVGWFPLVCFLYLK